MTAIVHCQNQHCQAKDNFLYKWQNKKNESVWLHTECALKKVSGQTYLLSPKLAYATMSTDMKRQIFNFDETVKSADIGTKGLRLARAKVNGNKSMEVWVNSEQIFTLAVYSSFLKKHLDTEEIRFKLGFYSAYDKAKHCRTYKDIFSCQFPGGFIKNCKHIASSEAELIKHIHIKHEGIRYLCPTHLTISATRDTFLKHSSKDHNNISKDVSQYEVTLLA